MVEFVPDAAPRDEAVNMIIGPVAIRGIYEVTESGSGITEEYKAERERESGGEVTKDEVDEPPAAELEITAWGTESEWNQLNQLRQRRDPFPVSVGPFTYEEMGIANLEQTIDGEHPEAREFSILLQEFREVVVQRRDMDEVLGGGDSAGGEPGSVDGPAAGNTEYGGTPRTIPANGHTQYDVGDGETWGGELIDVTANGAAATIRPQGGGWVVENVGLRGEFDGRDLDNGDVFLHPTASGGTSAIRHIYMADGAVNPRDTGMLIDSASTGALEIARVNVQQWPDNGIYGSAPAGSAEIEIQNCYAHNNQTSDYRLASGLINNCVAVRDGNTTRGNRNVWVWAPGPVEVTDCQIANRNGGTAIDATGGRNDPGGTVNVTGNSSVEGGTSGTVNGSFDDSANVDDYHSGIPGSAADAAEGTSANATGTPGGGVQ